MNDPRTPHEANYDNALSVSAKSYYVRLCKIMYIIALHAALLCFSTSATLAFSHETTERDQATAGDRLRPTEKEIRGMGGRKKIRGRAGAG